MIVGYRRQLGERAFVLFEPNVDLGAQVAIDRRWRSQPREVKKRPLGLNQSACPIGGLGAKRAGLDRPGTDASP